MVLVNGKVDAEVKRQADAVLASQGKTASEVIRSLFQSIASTCQLPDFMRDEDAQAEQRQRTQRLNLMMSVAGIIQSSPPLTDDDVDSLLWEETVRRHA